MRVVFFFVHGGYADSFLRGAHEYLVPTPPGEAPADLAAWPSARAVPVDRVREEDADVVVLQRLEEIRMLREAGLEPGADIPAVFLEHNTPKPRAVDSRHPLADQRAIPIVHVTHFNELYWDSGRARTFVVEHGIPDPGPLYRGGEERIAAVINEPARRGRVTGTDLLRVFARVAPVDVFGISADAVTSRSGHGIHAAGDLSPGRLHGELARRRVYLHPYRWTSLGLSLLEAMTIAMPVIAVAGTEAVRAIPPGAGIVSTELAELVRGARAFLADPDMAMEAGRRARAHALEHYGLERFLSRWDDVLAEVSGAARTGSRQTEGSGR